MPPSFSGTEVQLDMRMAKGKVAKATPRLREALSPEPRANRFHCCFTARTPVGMIDPVPHTVRQLKLRQHYNHPPLDSAQRNDQKRNRKVLPKALLSRKIRPLWLATICLTRLRPSPAPVLRGVMR
ncbi:hypothetical protein D3C80_627310 [compost metagenome]